MKISFFTSGQFAKLCGTTKETLRHYNNIGILKPEKVGKNGYQYYSYRQLVDFHLISTLKSTGCSLETIYKYIYKQSKVDFQEVLINQLNELLIEKENIIKREQILLQSIKKFDLIKKTSILNTYFIEENEEEYFIVTKLDSITSDIEWIKTINEHLKFCDEKNINIEYQISYIMINNLDKEEYYIGSKINSRINSERLHIKQSGKYIQYIHKGEYNPDKIYDGAKEFAKKQGLHINKNIYESEISLYIDPNTESYITEISIQVD